MTRGSKANGELGVSQRMSWEQEGIEGGRGEAEAELEEDERGLLSSES